MSVLRKLLRVLLPVLALAAGVGVFALLVVTRPEPVKKPREERGALVQTIPIKGVREQLRLVEHGTVVAAEQITLQAEVSAKVVWQHEDLVPGGRFKKGQTLVRLDARNYRLQVEQQHANVDRAQLEVQLERARKDIAKDEWQIIGEDAKATPEGRALALREPQLAAAKAGLESAKSAKAQASLAVSKTVLKAPFNGFVKTETVDLGQLVAPQTPLATLVGTDEFWVQVSVPVQKLPMIAVPGFNAAEGEGAKATIVYEVGNKRTERSGHVLRLMGDLDPVGRMARVLVSVQDPFGIDSEAQQKQGETAPAPVQMPILLGSYVEVSILAQEVADVVEVPRLALRDGDSVYVYGKEGRLEVRPVEIAWRRENSVLVKKGVRAGEEVVVSRLPSAVPGMRLRKAPAQEPKAVLGKR